MSYNTIYFVNKEGSNFYIKVGAPCFEKICLYDTRKGIVCSYRRLFCRTVMAFTTILSKRNLEFLHSDFCVSVLENFFVWGVTVPLKNSFCAAAATFSEDR